MAPSPFPDNPDGLFITGGFNGDFAKSSELLTDTGWISSLPELPVSMYSHSMATINASTVMAIGGKQPG